MKQMDNKLNSWEIEEIKTIHKLGKNYEILNTGIGEDVQRQKLPSTAGKSVCWYNSSEEQFVNI